MTTRKLAPARECSVPTSQPLFARGVVAVPPVARRDPASSTRRGDRQVGREQDPRVVRVPALGRRGGEVEMPAATAIQVAMLVTRRSISGRAQEDGAGSMRTV